MSNHSPVFAQITRHLDPTEFTRCAALYPPARPPRGRSAYSRRAYPQKLRRVRVRDEERGISLVLLTNHLDLPAATIALLDVRPGRGLVVPTLAVCGLFSLHVTELLVVIGIVGCAIAGKMKESHMSGGVEREREACLALLEGRLHLLGLVHDIMQVSERHRTDHAPKARATPMAG